MLRNPTRTGIANQLAFADIHGLGECYLRDYVARVRATSAAEVQRIARQYLDPAKLAIVVVGDRSKVLGQLQGLGEPVAIAPVVPSP